MHSSTRRRHLVAGTYDDVRLAEPEVDTAGAIELTVDVRNDGPRTGAEVVRLYGHDVVGSITRPVAQLLAYARVDLAPGETVSLRMRVPSTRLAFRDRRMRRVVEPGAIDLWLGRSCAERIAEVGVSLVGDVHQVELTDARWSEVEVTRRPPDPRRRVG